MVLSRLFAGLKRTRERLSSGLARVLSIGRKLDETVLEELEEVLYTSDLGPTGSAIVAELQEAYKMRELREVAEVPDFLRNRLMARLEGCEGPLAKTAGTTGSMLAAWAMEITMGIAMLDAAVFDIVSERTTVNSAAAKVRGTTVSVGRRVVMPSPIASAKPVDADKAPRDNPPPNSRIVPQSICAA